MVGGLWESWGSGGSEGGSPEETWGGGVLKFEK